MTPDAPPEGIGAALRALAKMHDPDAHRPSATVRAGRPALADGGMRGECRVCAEPVRYEGASWCSGACRQVERQCWWALMREKGDFRAKRWARAQLGRDGPPAGEGHPDGGGRS